MFAARRIVAHSSALRPAFTHATGRAQAPTRVVRRTLAGHGSAPPATGWEGEVRKVLKEDWQVVCGIMGFYTTLYLVSKLFSGGKKAAPDTVAASSSATSASSEVISMADDKFSEYVGNSENMLKWEQSLNDPKAYE
ncbi:hypothetical protein Naga_100022g46 [Nannochloropsis gaditana]|uniref:Uncharacterized protein n=1 Tax=Nannochloropsis gaditana TaxID=72520 RepID=W7TR71_9STRA|nr:hypothetical protein Naga_100022g46 [Nannochloropsis gaditana]